MLKQNWTTFKTTIGTCGIAWTQQGISQLALPENTLTILKTRFHSKTFSKSPPLWVLKIISLVQKHFAGNLQDFSSVPLCLDSLPDFHQKVYKKAQKIPHGTTLTYGELAKIVGNPLAARAVGQALGKNPISLIVPCHRIVAAGKKPGGFTAHGGVHTKAKMLAIEGIDL